MTGSLEPGKIIYSLSDEGVGNGGFQLSRLPAHTHPDPMTVPTKSWRSSHEGC